MSANTCRISRAPKPRFKSINRSLNGRAEEEKVREYFLNRGFILVASNHRIAGVEIDLVFTREEYAVSLKENGICLKENEICLTLIEVKTLSNPRFFETRLKSGQIGRIRRALGSLLERGVRARAHLALVSKEGIQIIEDYFVRDL